MTDQTIAEKDYRIKKLEDEINSLKKITRSLEEQNERMSYYQNTEKCPRCEGRKLIGERCSCYV